MTWRFFWVPTGNQRNKETTHYAARLVPIEGKLFFDGEFEKEEGSAASVRSEQLPLGVLPTHVIGRAFIEPDFLVVVLPSSSWVRDNTPEAFREFKDLYKYSEVSVISASTQDLRHFMVQQAESLILVGRFSRDPHWPVLGSSAVLVKAVHFCPTAAWATGPIKPHATRGCVANRVSPGRTSGV